MEWLREFYETIAEDSRITTTHISLYVAIRYSWEHQGCTVLLELNRAMIMQLAKISSPVTYRKCLHELHEFGYIQYAPFFGRKRSEVKFRRL